MNIAELKTIPGSWRCEDEFKLKIDEYKKQGYEIWFNRRMNLDKKQELTKKYKLIFIGYTGSCNHWEGGGCTAGPDTVVAWAVKEKS